MTERGPVVLILGSGPNVVQAAGWHRSLFDHIVVINNAWQVRPDWDALVFPEDFPAHRMPPRVGPDQTLVDASAFVPAQNRYGGFVFAGATMAFTTAYWALAEYRPGVMAFMGCDMVYPDQGPTHFYGAGAADPLRADISLRDLGAKSARLSVLAALQGCACVNLSGDVSRLMFPRCDAADLHAVTEAGAVDRHMVGSLLARERALGYATPDGRHDALQERADLEALDALDRDWQGLSGPATGRAQSGGRTAFPTGQSPPAV